MRRRRYARAAWPSRVRSWVVWEPLSSYATLQPVVRLYPQSGECARAMAFHYLPEEWALAIWCWISGCWTRRAAAGDGYRIGVGFYDPSRDEALPRLADERFAGFEAIYPAPSGELRFDPMPGPLRRRAGARGLCAAFTSVTGAARDVELVGLAGRATDRHRDATGQRTSWCVCAGRPAATLLHSAR